MKLLHVVLAALALFTTLSLVQAGPAEKGKLALENLRNAQDDAVLQLIKTEGQDMPTSNLKDIVNLARSTSKDIFGRSAASGGAWFMRPSFWGVELGAASVLAAGSIGAIVTAVLAAQSAAYRTPAAVVTALLATTALAGLGGVIATPLVFKKIEENQLKKSDTARIPKLMNIAMQASRLIASREQQARQQSGK
jgi:hypothetical protein